MGKTVTEGILEKPLLMVTEVVSGFLGKVASCQRRTNTRRVGNIGATIRDKVTVKPTPEEFGQGRTKRCTPIPYSH